MFEFEESQKAIIEIFIARLEAAKAKVNDYFDDQSLTIQSDLSSYRYNYAQSKKAALKSAVDEALQSLEDLAYAVLETSKQSRNTLTSCLNSLDCATCDVTHAYDSRTADIL